MRAALAATLGAGVLAVFPFGAVAAGPNSCDASVLRLSVLSAATIDPLHANPGFDPCASDDVSILSLPLPGGIGVNAVRATTTNAPNDAAVSRAEITGLRVPVTGLLGTSQLNALTGALLAGPNSIVGGLVTQVDEALASVTLLSTLTSTLGLQPFDSDRVVTALTTKLHDNLGPALQSAVPQVLTADVIQATAQTRCVSGDPRLSGHTHYANLTALGQGIDPDSALDGPLNVDTQALNLGTLLSVEDVLDGIKIKSGGPVALILGALLGQYDSLYKLLYMPDGLVKTLVNGLLLPLNTSLAGILTTITTPLQHALDAITVTVPKGLLHAKITPRSQAIAGDELTQNAITVSISALDLPLLSGTLAQARVGSGAPGCTPPLIPPIDPPDDTPPAVIDPPPTQDREKPTPKEVKDPVKYSSPEAEAVLQCAKAPATLIDVFEAGRRTYVQGVAERRYIGQRATIYLQHGKKKVGTVKIDEDGLFSTQVALPPRKIRTTNKARYYAVVGGRKTRALKFSRRMLTTGLTASKGTVRLRGQVTAPRRHKQARVVLKQRVSCTRYKTVATVKPNAKGRFSVKIQAPPDLGAAIYRAQTRVPRERTSKRDFRTFTLPRVIGL